MPKSKADSEEFDLHIWAKPETANMVKTFTVSMKGHPLCVDMPIKQALDSIRKALEETAN
jgi:hypothetical protein